ncbi:MAG: hypothetical protein SGJ27_24325 [Candidatus Melainabacteria bacterium]|mgnify:CR=1 FL=1|nr:hypothetical protein [Candidatus Melainabacteria bacterium]
MYRPKKHVRLTSLPNAPRGSDVKSLLEEAKKAKGCTVELPWKNKLTGVQYSLTTRLEVAGGSEPIWTLYEGEGGKSRVVWSSPFEDVDLLYDVLMLSIPEEVETEFRGPAPTSRQTSNSMDGSISNSNVGQSGAYSSPAASGQNGEFSSPGAGASEFSTSTNSGTYISQTSDSGLLTGNEEVELPKSKKYQPGLASSAEFALLADVEEKPKAKAKTAKETEAEAAAAAAAAQAQQQQGAPQPQNMQSGAYPQQNMQSGAYPQQNMQSGAYPQQQLPPGMQSGSYPQQYGYPPGYQQYPGYPQGYYPGYPGYPPYPYPPGSVPPASTVALQQQQLYQQQQAGQQQRGAGAPTDTGAHAKPPQDPSKPRPNLRLGQFLVESGLVPESTVDAALQLQELVRSGSLSTAQAAEAVRRAHIRGGAVDPKLIAAPVGPNDSKTVAPPLGQILVEAAIIRGPIIRQALKLQESIRSGEMTKDDALDALCLEVFGVGRKIPDTTGETADTTEALELLRKAQLVSDFDHETASKVRDKHGGQIVSILVKAGKLDQHTADGAFKCNQLVNQKKIEQGKAIIALHYCQRSRIDLDSALKELGWES